MAQAKIAKKKEILYVTAFDENGNLVKAKNAEKNNVYFCPECSDKLILKKSGKTGKGSKRPHFAHYSESPNCTPEGVLHKSFKLLLLEKIKQNIANKTPINISWECIYCNEKHQGNLLQFVVDTKEEYIMDKCRPDIALFSQDEKVFVVIEIVVTHKPEDTTLAYYKENKIILIQIELNCEDDLESIDTKINKPNSIDYCYNIKCPNHGGYLFKRKLKVFQKPCGNFHIMLSCIAETHHYFGLQQSSDFTDNEIEFAKSKDVRFENNKVICPHCRAIRNKYRGGRIF